MSAKESRGARWTNSPLYDEYGDLFEHMLAARENIMMDDGECHALRLLPRCEHEPRITNDPKLTMLA